MGKSASLTARWLAIALALHLGTAHALCLDPASGQSGCRVPLDLEARRAEAIVIGRVLSEQGLPEDPDDPDGYTAWNARGEVLDSLKGNAPRFL